MSIKKKYKIEENKIEIFLIDNINYFFFELTIRRK